MGSLIQMLGLLRVVVVVISFSRSESARTETAIQTDLPSQRTGADTTRSLGPTTLLRDSVIRVGEDGGRKESPKTAVLLALSRPSRPISRTQSQVTMAGDVSLVSLSALPLGGASTEYDLWSLLTL